MSQTLARTKPVKPVAAQVSMLQVVAARRVSAGFMRVTFAGADESLDASFEYLGFDQWFRLFLPSAPDAPLPLPYGDGEGWYTRWLAMDEATRPTIRNYTVREARRVEGRWHLDVDFVVHASAASGRVEGIAATWALEARPGQRVGMLDQGLLFNPGDIDGLLVVAADETGLPAAEGIARSLPAGARAVFALEIAHDDDRRDLPSAADLEVRWVVRDDPSALPGRAARRLVDDLPFDANGYVYTVGEASFVLETRQCAQHAGVPKACVDFCAYWRPTRRAAKGPTRAA